MKNPILDGLLDLLYPPKCPFCGRLLEKGALLCPECQRELPWLADAAAETEVELVELCVSAMTYDDRVKKGIYAFKFYGKSVRGTAFGILIAQCLKDHGVTADVVSWPPLSKKRLRRRGYDQSKLLAEKVGEELGLPVLGTLTKEDRPAQSGIKDAAARRANLLGAYTVIDPEQVRGKRILLIDDVVTTGATLSECAKVLLLAGAESVICGTLAKAK